MAEIEETVNRIRNHKSVQGLLICNAEGKIIRNNFQSNPVKESIAKNIPQLAIKARNTIRDLDPSNDLTFLRIRSRDYEVMAAPDKEFVLIVIQDTKVEKKEGEP